MFLFLEGKRKTSYCSLNTPLFLRPIPKRRDPQVILTGLDYLF